MWTREPLGTYFTPGSFGNPDDYLAFIGDNVGHIVDDAQRSFLVHGRGIVLFQGEGFGFLKAWYVTGDEEDFKDVGPNALEDYRGYDPERELLVGATNTAETFFWFWRAKLGT